MSEQIIGMHQWLQTPAGRCLLDWESQQLDAAVADIFGYHALQLGVPQLPALRANRMPHQWLATQGAQALAAHPMPSETQPVALQCDFAALPFAPTSLDLVVLPHTLEFSTDPHAALREVERVLVPEGRVVVCGFNPWSLWAARSWRARQYQRLGLGQDFLPTCHQHIGLRRLRDWLRLLGFEVELARYGCFRPALDSAQWLQRFAWMDRLESRHWAVFGAVYMVVAVKRVRGMRLIGASWKRAPMPAGAAVSAGNPGANSKGKEKDRG